MPDALTMSIQPLSSAADDDRIEVKSIDRPRLVYRLIERRIAWSASDDPVLLILDVGTATRE
jgi:hypothetical protein